MEIIEREINGTAPNLLCICVDRVSREEGAGRLYHYYAREPIRFESCLELLWKMERFYDWVGHPQASTKPRSLLKNQKTAQIQKGEAIRVMDEEELTGKAGEKATFIVHVERRQNATWQGKVVWAEKQVQQNFRSVLELLRLMDTAMEAERQKATREERASEDQ